jgi:ankyrin repeat protein
VDNQDFDGNTPLHAAVMTSQLDVVKLLVERGKASLDIQNYDLSCPSALHNSSYNSADHNITPEPAAETRKQPSFAVMPEVVKLIEAFPTVFAPSVAE